MVDAGDTASMLFHVSVTGYLMLGLVMMMLLLAVLYEIPELNLGFHFYMKSDDISEEEVSLRSSIKKEGLQYTKQVDDKSSNQSTQGLSQVIDEWRH